MKMRFGSSRARFITLIGSITISLLLAGCSKPEDKFIGTWKDEDDTAIQTVILEPEGKATIKTVYGNAIHLHWKIVDKEKSLVKMWGYSGKESDSTPVKWVVEGDTLIWRKAKTDELLRDFKRVESK